MRYMSYALAFAAVVVFAAPASAQDYTVLTAPGDPVIGVPDDGDWPGGEHPGLAIDQDLGTKYLHFKGDFDPDPGTGGTGIRVTPSGGRLVVKALNFAAANDVPARDPIQFRLSGSNGSLEDGPYTVIAEGMIEDFAQSDPWPRDSWISAPIEIENFQAYDHYEILFTEIRDAPATNSMQIAEIELLTDGSTPWRIEPAGRLVQAGSTVTLEGELDSEEEVTYQWQKNGEDLAGETSTVLTLTDVTAADAGQYRVIATVDGVETSSRVASISVAENLPTAGAIGLGALLLALVAAGGVYGMRRQRDMN